MAGAIDPGLRKFHASLNVTDLDRSVAFYRVLLGAEPAKLRHDYAKFDLADPPLVLSLVPGRPAGGGHLNHAGLRVRSTEELLEVQRRLEAAGMPTRREDGVACCDAMQTKFWIADPDGALWEIYVFHEDIAGTDAPASAAAAHGAPAAWEHHLRDPIPAAIPFADGALDEVRLEGSINMDPAAGGRDGLLREALRALRPGGAVRVHGLAGDRPCHARLTLPGPAAAVQHVPAVDAVVAELMQAGFANVTIELLSEVAYFVVDGVQMRELRVRGQKPAA